MSPWSSRIGATLVAVVALVAGVQTASAETVLRVGAADDPDSLDPARAYARESLQVLANTGGGLVSFRREAGRAGAEIVPMLARQVPTPTAGGRRLVFRLRPGVRFGPPSGRRVRPSDVKASLERLFLVGSPGRGLYRGIVGATAFERTKRGGIRGLVADDRTGRLEVRLTRADGGILSSLAMPFAHVVPAEWDSLGLTRPPAGLGPYYVRGYRRGSFIDLARNPFYAPAGGLPRGSVDQILVRIGASSAATLTSIERGRLDATQSTVPAAALRGRTARARAVLDPTTHSLVLNTRRPPFDNPRHRRAAAAAIGGRGLAQVLGREGRAQGDIIPAVVPGGVATPPADADPELARRIGSRAAPSPPVVVWASTDEPAPAIARIVARDLRAAGIRASTRLVSRPTLLRELGDPQGDVQIAYVRARHATLDPGGYLRLAVPGGGGSLDYTGLTDADVRRLATRAVATWGVRPRAEAWARVSSALRTAAVYLPFAASVRWEPVGRRVSGYVGHPLYGFLWMRARVPAEG